MSTLNVGMLALIAPAIFIITAPTCASQSISSPSINCWRIGTDWQKIDVEGAKFGLYSSKGDDLFCKCHAAYPIEWNITGVITPEDMVRIQPVKRDLVKNTFQIGINIFFREAHKLDVFPTSTKLVCQTVLNQDSNLQEHISVFVEGNKQFVEQKGHHGTIVRDSQLIPCPTTNPTTTTQLYIKTTQSNNNQKLVENVVYDPTEGFRSNNNEVFDGVYTCKKQSASVSVTAHSNQHLDHQYSPFPKSVRILTGDTVEFHCSSKPKPVTLKFKVDSGELNITDVANSARSKVAQISMKNIENANTVKGKGVCVVDGNEIVHEWALEFIKAPELYLDNFEGEADCLSESSPKMVQTVRCFSPMHCNYMTHCLSDHKFCNFKKQKQFYGQDDAYCWVESLKRGKPCSSVPFSHLNGVVQCTALGVAKKWEFFLSLDYQRYSNWEDAPKNELVRMDPVPRILYANKLTQFFCTGSAFLFADSISFEIEFQNGTRRILQNDDKNVKITNPYSENPRKIDELNVIGVLDIQLPVEAVGINCLAPWANSTDVMKTSSKFVTKAFPQNDIDDPCARM